MTYFPNIPLDTDLPSASAGQFRQNFTTLNSAFGIDHTPFATATNQGFHIKSTYIPYAAGAFPPLAGGIGQGIVFAKTITAGPVTETISYYRKDDNARYFPVIPVRAYVKFIAAAGAFVGAVAPIGTPNNDFNIAITKAVGQTYTFTMTDALPDMNYIIYTSQFAVHTITSGQVFTLHYTSAAPLDVIDLMVFHYRLPT